MDNTDTFHRRSYRVLATYRGLASDYLGMAQVILAFIIVVTSIVGFAVDVSQSVSVTSLVLASLVSLKAQIQMSMAHDIVIVLFFATS